MPHHSIFCRPDALPEAQPTLSMKAKVVKEPNRGKDMERIREAMFIGFGDGRIGGQFPHW